MTYIDLKARKKASELMLAQFGLKLERGIKENCDLCRTSYTVFNRQHICKRCHRSVCAQCSPFKVKTYLASRNIRLHRNCVICNAESVKIQQYIEQNKLRFRQDSDLLFIWSKALTDRRGVKVSRSKSILKSYVQLQNLWGSFNFSFREFVGRLVEKSNISDADLINTIGNGLEQIERMQGDSLENGLYIYIFFLCHADVEVAVNLTIFILQLLQKSNTSKATLKKLMQNIGFSEIQIYKLEEFLLENEVVLKDSASVNVLPVTATFDIISSAITNKSITFMWKGLLLFLAERKDVVFKNLNKISTITLDLLRNPTIVNLKPHFKLQSEAAGEEHDAKYGKLLSDYKVLLTRNQILEKEVSEVSDRNTKDKILSDSMLGLGEEATSHSSIFKAEDFYQILQGKNEEIIRLKMKNEELQLTAKKRSSELDKYAIQNLDLKNSLAEKEQRVCKLEEEKSSLKNINSLLLEKMKDLSKMLMDQEEQQILNNDKVIEEIAKQLGQGQEQKEDCNIY